MTTDELWYEIMHEYIPDDLTMIETLVVSNLHILAVASLEHRYESLEIYYGNSWKDVFDGSGYLVGLLDQGKEYFLESFNSDEYKLLCEEYERWIKE